MNILFKSFHIIDIENTISHKKDIPDGFNVFLEDFISYANKNEKNKEFQPVYEDVELYKQIRKVLDESKRDEIADFIAKKLVGCENLAQAKIFQMGTSVKKGSLVQALIQVDETKYQYVIAKVEHSMWYDAELNVNYGFPGDKNTIWKSAIIPFNVLDGEIFFNKIQVFVDNRSKYWTVSFLEVEEVRDDFSNTYAAFKAIDSELKTSIKDISPRDYTVLSDELITTMNKPQDIKFNDYVEEMMHNYHPSSKEIEKDVILDCLLALPERKNFDTEFKTVPSSITNKRTKKYKIADGIELTIRSDATEFSSKIVSTMENGMRILQIVCEDEETYESFIQE